MNTKWNDPHRGVGWLSRSTAWKACVTFLLAGTLHAATVFNDSPNVIVDTRDLAAQPPTVTVTMHQVAAPNRVASPNLFENAVPTTGVDEPLRVKAASSSVFATLPQLPAWNSGTNSGGGLVADGVTPVMFRIVADGTPWANGNEYDISVARKSGQSSLAQPEPPKLSLPGSSAPTTTLRVKLTPSNPEAFVVLNPIRSEDLIGSGAAGPVVARLAVRDATTVNEKGGMDFGISRPPVVLVHGYNVTDPNWGAYFTNNLGVDRAPGFVIAVGYGLTDGSNTGGELRELAKKLHSVLGSRIEQSDTHEAVLNQWAWTRYDAVGHSQGGLLLRYLCSQLAKAGAGTVHDDGFEPWRNVQNHYRGRFHRVVTVGSPHAGSTIAHLAICMMDRGVGLPHELSGMDFFKRLLQRKFMIDNGGPGRPETVQQVNRQYICDPSARIHALGATIEALPQPWSIYSLLEINTASRVESLIPYGSDAIVDLRSQCTSLDVISAHSSRISPTEHVAHAGLPDSLEPVWKRVVGTDQTERTSQAVAERVTELLGGSGAAFSSINIAETFHDTMNNTAAAIDTFVTEMQAAHQQFRRSMMAGPPLPGLAALNGAVASGTTGTADQIINLVLDPPDGESPNGPVEWVALVYGPSGLTTDGLTLQTTGVHGEQLALTVAAAVRGEVVVAVRFPSTSGTVAIGTPTVVMNRPPGTTLTGIALSPATLQGQVHEELPLTVSGIYDGQTTTALFTSEDNTTFESSNPAVVTVDASRRAKLLALGTATITATYNGTHTATCEVTVLDVAPVVVNPPTIPATVGQYLWFQLSASQVVQSFAMDAIPAGLALGAQTGVIEGVPATEGRFPAVLTVTNANGTSSKGMEFVITGVPGAPTDVGLDASGVSEQKPIGTLVGRLVTTDPNPLDTFTYQLVTGTGSTDNASFTITGDQVFTAAVLSRAVTPSVSIRVRTTDSSAANFEKVIVLPVMAPPAITRQPDARRVFTGEQTVFSVEASGLEPLNYQWKKDGVDVSGGNGRILEIAAANPSDAGSYSVTVTNSDGSATSAPASLVVDATSYEKWLSQVPNATGGPVYEPLGDYNQDGIQNFLEFAFGVPPGAASGSGAKPFFTSAPTGPVFTYYTANGIQPLTSRVMKSGDLSAWTEHIPAPGDVTTVDHGGYTEVRVRMSWGDPKMFLRLEVSSP